MAGKANVLIVDDSKNNQEICRICLEAQNYLVYVAGDGAEGLKSAKRIKPDLILLDIMMPVMDGYQMIVKLKTDPDLADIPVLVLSVITDMADVVKAFELGANDFLKKPFNMDEFIARVNALVKHKQTQTLLKQYAKKLREEQNHFKFEVQKWTREAEALQQKFDTTLADVSDKSNTDGNLEQIINTTRQAKMLIRRMLSVGGAEGYKQVFPS